ncbi:3'-5' exonuclease [Pseudidiomarina donghaiensis]|uniref:3'-5' exonuclease n=1 Tax=Pseudidiomarina donghaiensis TaxID=519452 RepID=A0A432XKY3_9GAMM|nr:3'-5' exonuclease [Pseudidiomarina donghaiensis]RUO49361.1 3'-5' exonuclease [Pseudidiomarina donghaiensis]SFV21071.1 DNA polymerase-3 subunit epsilon [Pseudidiomarina donghaiensis]
MGNLKRWLKRWLQQKKPWTEHTYVALDVESSGLDPHSDQLLAVAWVVIKPPVIDYASGRYYLIKHDQTELKQSPVVHGLVSKDFIDPTEPVEVLRELAKVLKDNVLVCHYIRLDWGFLKQAAKQHGIKLEPLARFDTLAYEAQRLKRHQHHIARGELTLNACRTRYGLPEYNAHHAFSDAIACGELMLAQRYK